MVKKDKNVCPQCGKPAEWKGNPFHPFCSERCRLIDLGQWAAEKYRIPGEKVKPGTDEETEEKTEEKKGDKETE